MQETKITMQRIRNHFAYGWWKYVLLVLLAVFGWNLIYTSTAYRAPKDKRLDVYFVTYAVPSETTDWLSSQILSMYPNVEDSNCLSIVYTPEDNYYGAVQVSTYIGAREGDAFVLSKERFDAFKTSGVFMPLDDLIAQGSLSVQNIDISSGYTTLEDTGERVLAGIPASTLYGFMEHGVDNRDLYICIMSYSQNQGTAIKFVDWLVETMQGEKPDWITEEESKRDLSGAQEGISDITSY